MSKYKIEKKGRGYYARRYSKTGFLLDSLVFGKRSDAEKTIKIWKKIERSSITYENWKTKKKTKRKTKRRKK